MGRISPVRWPAGERTFLLPQNNEQKMKRPLEGHGRRTQRCQREKQGFEKEGFKARPLALRLSVFIKESFQKSSTQHLVRR